MAVHHTPVDALSCTVTMILFIYLYMNKGYNPRAGSAPNLPYHTIYNQMIITRFKYLQLVLFFFSLFFLKLNNGLN